MNDARLLGVGTPEQIRYRARVLGLAVREGGFANMERDNEYMTRVWRELA